VIAVTQIEKFTKFFWTLCSRLKITRQTGWHSKGTCCEARPGLSGHYDVTNGPGWYSPSVFASICGMSAACTPFVPWGCVSDADGLGRYRLQVAIADECIGQAAELGQNLLVIGTIVSQLTISAL